MHNTNVSFQKENLPLGKICGTSDKTPTTKTTWRKKTQKHRENQKKQKNLGFQGKVLGVTSPKSLVFFCFFCFFWFFLVFSSFFVFLIFLNSFSDLVFFCFLIFQTISQKRFFEVDSMWIVHSRFCAGCPFSTKLCARCPTACLSYSSFLPKQTASLYPYYLAAGRLRVFTVDLRIALTGMSRKFAFQNAMLSYTQKR